MQHLKFFKDIKKNNVDIAGGKGASLGEMTNTGLAVPSGFVVLSNAFDRFIEETELKEEIDARLKEVNANDVNSVDRASNIIRDIIHDTPMPDDLTKEIDKAFDELGAEFVAVRSAEDSSIASWAGELETYLNTTKDNLCENVKKCWSSLFTPRAIFYRFEKNLHDQYVSVAVVIQKMIQSEISGIAFTVHPVTEDPNQMIIEAGFGLGEAIVSGQITPDSYIVDKSDLSIMDISIGTQTRKLIKKRGNVERGMRNGGDERGTSDEERGTRNEWVELNKDESEKQKLTGKQIIEVAEVCKKIEDHYGFPCDIEWAMEGGKVYVTQSRPITTLKK